MKEKFFFFLSYICKCLNTLVLNDFCILVLIPANLLNLLDLRFLVESLGFSKYNIMPYGNSDIVSFFLFDLDNFHFFFLPSCPV